MKDEALKLALEALEWEEAQTAYPSRMMIEAITSVKQALASPAPEVSWGVDWGRAGDKSCAMIIKRLPDGKIEVIAVEYEP